MESLGEEPWDVAICGTGLQQSLLALALSRSDKRIIHLDPNDYYGGSEAAFSLQEAETWAARHSALSSSIFTNASVSQHPEAANRGLSSPRAYSLALAPQIIHTRSNLLAQLVSSRAYRQVEFLAVGSFFVYEPASTAEVGSGRPQLSRIPSSREAVFAARSLFDRSSMRSIMSFLKFVPNYDSEEQRPRWEGQASNTFASFLESEFKLGARFKAYVLALTMALDDQITVKDGLVLLHRHLTSTNFFGPGFCAVYPKWGGLSEIAQVGCRAGAVGGAIYMLGTSSDEEDSSGADKIPLKLSNGISVQTSNMVSSDETTNSAPGKISRLIAIVDSKFEDLFEVVAEGAPIPAVVPITFPGGSLSVSDDGTHNPVYAMVHSSDTGECPSGQSVLYLTTLATSKAKEKLESALSAVLKTSVSPVEERKPASSLYELYYEQGLNSNREISVTTNTQAGGDVVRTSKIVLPGLRPSLAFDDADLNPVKTAWESMTASWGLSPGEETNHEYMAFDDREGAAADDYEYD